MTAHPSATHTHTHPTTPPTNNTTKNKQTAKLFNAHLLGTREVGALHEAADTAIDCANEPLCDWELLAPDCTPRGVVRWLEGRRVPGLP